MKISKEIREAIRQAVKEPLEPKGSLMEAICDKAEEILNKPKLNSLQRKALKALPTYTNGAGTTYLPIGEHLIRRSDVDGFLSDKVEFPEIGLKMENDVFRLREEERFPIRGMLVQLRQNCRRGKYEDT